MPSEEDVSNFIRTTFRSVWALELLCFLRQDRSRSHSHEEMVAGLRGSDLVVTQSVGSLTAGGLVVAEGDGSCNAGNACTVDTAITLLTVDRDIISDFQRERFAWMHGLDAPRARFVRTRTGVDVEAHGARSRRTPVGREQVTVADALTRRQGRATGRLLRW